MVDLENKSSAVLFSHSIDMREGKHFGGHGWCSCLRVDVMRTLRFIEQILKTMVN